MQDNSNFLSFKSETSLRLLAALPEGKDDVTIADWSAAARKVLAEDAEATKVRTAKPE